MTRHGDITDSRFTFSKISKTWKNPEQAILDVILDLLVRQLGTDGRTNNNEKYKIYFCPQMINLMKT